MNILIINAGSSSFKYQLLDMTNEQVLCSGLVERIGESVGKLIHKSAPDTDKEEKIVQEKPFPNHVFGMKEVVALITHKDRGVIASTADVHAIGHRIVMGGEAIKEAVLIDENIKDIIRRYIPLSPLHNPANLAGIEVAEELFPGVPNVGVFDTEFHQTMPEAAYMYPLPYDVYATLRIRRYGFHGTSHRYVSRVAAEFLGKKPEDVNLITCHLGNGCSIAAIKAGKCVDTSMGTTPLDGLMMGTRCGEIDPAIVPLLIKAMNKTPDEIDTLMNKESGLKGICGKSDLRDIHDAIAAGDAKAKLALDMFTYRVKKFIGAYFAVLGHIDALVFTAGIGENDALVRAHVCDGLEKLGIEICFDENAKRSGKPRSLSPVDTLGVPVLVIPTNEELEIAHSTMRVVTN